MYTGKRLFDVVASGLALLAFAVPMLVIAAVVRASSAGPVLYWSDRIGRNNQIFKMPKIRTMRLDTPALATHLMKDPGLYLTPVGGFLRRSSLDEIPQLLSVLRGDMSLVGPRPALFNQHDLIALRSENGVQSLRPGITGWAQVNGRDELSIPDKVRFDVQYLAECSFWFDLRIIFRTVFKVAALEGVSH